MGQTASVVGGGGGGPPLPLSFERSDDAAALWRLLAAPSLHYAPHNAAEQRLLAAAAHTAPSAGLRRWRRKAAPCITMPASSSA